MMRLKLYQNKKGLNIITLALALTFFILAFMIIGGSLNFVNSNTAQAEKITKTNCVEVSYEINTISYNEVSRELTFNVRHVSEFSNEPLTGISVRLENNSDYKMKLFDNPLSNGQSKEVVIDNFTMSGNMFFVSVVGCPSDYEKRCYLSKGDCS